MPRQSVRECLHHSHAPKRCLSRRFLRRFPWGRAASVAPRGLPVLPDRLASQARSDRPGYRGPPANPATPVQTVPPASGAHPESQALPDREASQDPRATPALPARLDPLESLDLQDRLERPGRRGRPERPDPPAHPAPSALAPTPALTASSSTP